jgi:23S rRNA pseudouridine2605 synthase
MRINQFIAQATGLSRRKADDIVKTGRVTISGTNGALGAVVTPQDVILLDGKPLNIQAIRTVVFHKPVGYICSRDGQGSDTIYDVLPYDLHMLKPVGRLDKNSSGILLLTNDGALAEKLTHPSQKKSKKYSVRLHKALTPQDADTISSTGVTLDDGLSRLTLQPQSSPKSWQITMHEGRNKQIRRTFEALGYRVTHLHRTSFGPYKLDDLPTGAWTECTPTATDSV